VLDFAAGFVTDWVVERLDVNRIVERLSWTTSSPA